MNELMTKLNDNIIEQGALIVYDDIYIDTFDEDDGFITETIQSGVYMYRKLNILGWICTQVLYLNTWIDLAGNYKKYDVEFIKF